MRYATGAAVLTALIAAEAIAQPVQGDKFAGRDFAREICAECHYVEDDWAEFTESYAPAFVDIAASRQFTDLAIRVFLQTPHIEMPNFILSQQQIDNIVAYIASLRPDSAN